MDAQDSRLLLIGELAIFFATIQGEPNVLPVQFK
jgi:hypothetical protein